MEVEEAKQVLENDLKARQELFLKEYRELCAKHRMQLVVQNTWTFAELK